MKKTTLLFSLFCVMGFAQQKTTGTLILNDNMTANLTLDNATSTAILMLSGPNDRWFSLQFGSFSGGMEAGADLVFWNGSTLVDAQHVGLGVSPNIDDSNDWTMISNENNIPSNGLRTLVYSRPFNTGDANDYTFIYSDTKIDLAYARMGSATFVLGYHGSSPNRDVLFNTDLNVLGVVSYSLDATLIYPNPSKGILKVKTNTKLSRISIYTQTGVLVKDIPIDLDSFVNDEIIISGLQSGIYLVELANEIEKSWKKIIVN